MLGKLLDGRYQVVKVLSAGGFGQTYIAEDTRRPGNPKCVLKQLKPVSSDPDHLEIARRLFNSEAEILEKLGNHDQIPRLLAYFEKDEEFFLVQELIVGHPLSSELYKGQPWSENQVVQILEDVLNVLKFVHHYGVIHRDIKPDNLIRRDIDGKLVLIDFGAVKQIRTQIPGKTSQVSGTIAIGTPGYMPAEQAQGKPRLNSDIYALGMIAIAILTGKIPSSLPENPQTGEIVWQNQVQLSPGLTAILQKMISYHWRDRYQSVEDIQGDLQTLNITLNSLKNSSQNNVFNNPLPPNQKNSLNGVTTNKQTSKVGVDDSNLTSEVTISAVQLTRILSVIKFIPFIGAAGLFFFKSATWLVLLGVILLALGAGLFFLGSAYPQLSRNYDTVFAAIIGLSGILLLFQEYRSSAAQEIPLTQFLLAGASICAIAQSIQLRSKVNDNR
ncbi:MAG: protein kinase [Cyanobacteria bacterium P01_A01_bin.45]